MSASSIKFRESGETALITTFTLEITAGTPGTPLAFDVWNAPDDPLAETARDLRIHIAERFPGETTWTQERDLTANRWLEMRVTGVIGDTPPYTTGWQPVGRGRPFKLNPIPAQSAISVELRDNVPGSAGNSIVEIYVKYTVEGPSVAIGLGPYYGGLSGIVSGIGDGTRSFIVSADPITASGSPDDEIHLGDMVWIGEGGRFVKLAHDLTVNGNAADGALAAAQAYWLTLYVDGAGNQIELKSNKGTAPLPVDDRPRPPNGEPVRAYVHRDFDGLIAQGDIYGAVVPGSFAIYGTGLTRSIGPGVALIDDRLADPDFPDSLTFPPSEAAIEVYLLPSGLKLATVNGRPDPRAILLYRAASGAGDLTALEDVRPFLRTRPGVLSFRFDATLAVDAFSYRTAMEDADLVLTYPEACRFTLDAAGAGTGGGHRADVEWWDGNSWESLFPSSGTVDRRPFVAVGASSLSAAGLPEVSKILKGTRLRARIVAIPTGGAAAPGAEVQLRYEVP